MPVCPCVLCPCVRPLAAACKSTTRLLHWLHWLQVYDWPFDATHGKGAANIDVLDIHGVPHSEQCDPGIFPSFFLDHGRPAGQAAFLDIFRKHIAGGDSSADGVCEF